MRTDHRSIRILLAAVAFLLAGNLLLQLSSSSSRRALAADQQKGGIPDAGAQAQAQIDQLTELNRKMDKLQSFLESGKLTVKVDAPKDKE